MKGVAGNLGAGSVQSTAAALEKAIAAGADSAALAGVLGAFTTTLDEFVIRLRAALPALEPAAPPTATATAIDPARLKAVVEEMLTHLRNFDAAAGDLLETQEDVFRFLLTPAEQAAFAGHVGGYAFDEALAVLEEAAKAKGLLST